MHRIQSPTTHNWSHETIRPNCCGRRNLFFGFSTGAFAISESEAASLNNQGEDLRSLGRNVEAEVLLRRSLTLALDELGPWHANVAVVKVNLAKVHMQEGRLDRAETLFHQAGKIYERIHGPEGPAVDGILLNLAMLHLRRGDLVDAESLGRRTLAVLRKRLGPEDLSVSSTLNTLGLIAHARHKFKEAEDYYRDSLRILSASSAEPLEEARVLGNLGRLLKDQKRWNDAHRRIGALSSADPRSVSPCGAASSAATCHLPESDR